MIKSNFSYKAKLFTYLSLLVFTIIIVVSTIYYVNIKNVVENNITESSVNTVMQLKNATETMLKDADRSLLKVATDSTVENFMFMYQEPDKDIIGIIEFLKRVNNAISYNKYFNSCLIYYMKENKVVDIVSGRIMDKNTMVSPGDYQMFSEISKEIIEKVSKLFEDQELSRDMYIFNIDTKHKNNVITLVKPVSWLYKDPKALLLITIDHAYFNDMLNSIKINEKSNVFIIDEEGKPVSTRNKKIYDFLQDQNAKKAIKLMKDNEGYFIADIDQEEYLISFVSSQKYGWKFVYTIPTQEIYRDLNITKIYILILTFLCLLFGIAVSFLFAGKLYVPINKIVTSLKIYNKSKSSSEKNDITYINEGIKLLISQNKSMEEMLNDSMPVMKNSLLNSILKNDLSPDENLWEKLSFYNSCILPDGMYAVCVVGFDEYRKIVAGYNEKQIGMLQIYQTGIIGNICEKYENIETEVVKINENEMALILSLKSADREEAKAIISEFISEAHKAITQNMKYTITIGIGSIYETIYQLHKSLGEARSAYGYKIIRGCNEIISFNDIPRIQEWYYKYPFDIEKSIFKYLKEGDMPSVNDELNKYFDHAHKHISDFTDNKYVFVQLLDNTLKSCVQMGLDVDEIFGKSRDVYKDLFNQETVFDIHSWFVALYKNLMQYISNKKVNKNDEIVSKTIEYIDNNYTLADISLEMLSEELHFSVSYLGKLFRDMTGKSIKEYITEKRVEQAKELLETTGMKVKDIGEMIGYPNTQSFIKIFKKYHGETPGEYQDRMFKKVL